MTSRASQAVRSTAAAKPRRTRVWAPIPAEGENGLFTQSWFGIGFSHELKRGELIGREFLDGKVVLMRGENGKVAALSAYCPHVGADLSVGKVVGNNVQCAFHNWEFNAEGYCERTGVGDAPPKAACVFKFPTQERYGLIWIFNGEEPLFDLPDFPYPDDELIFGSPYPMTPLACDPWIFCANTPDMQHLRSVHKMTILGDDPHELFTWDNFGFKYMYPGIDPGNVKTETTLSIRGSSIFYRSQVYGNFWKGSITGFGLPRPGMLSTYAINAVRKGPKAQEQLEMANAISQRIFSEDKDIMNTIRYKPGFLTKVDKSLSRFLTYIRNYPRAHPSADFIR